MTLGEKIRARRKELGMTMEDLGRAVGVQRSAINKYEKDMIKDPTRTIIAKFARALNVSPMYLMDDEPAGIMTSRLEVKGGKTTRLFAVDAASVRHDEKIRSDLNLPSFKSAEPDRELEALLKVWKVSTPEKRKAIVRVIKAMSKED